MPSNPHETLVDLFRQRPDLVLALAPPEMALPPGASVRLAPADLTRPRPITALPDLQIHCQDAQGRPVLAVLIEVQLKREPEKLLTWPAYLTQARRLAGLDAVLIVVTPSPSVARWAAQPIRIGPGNTITLTVMGPEQIPRITELDQAEAMTELAVLSALAHGRRPDGAEVMSTTLSACARLDPARAKLYTHMLFEAASAQVRQEMFQMSETEITLSPEVEKVYQFFRRLYLQEEARVQAGMEQGLERGLEQGREQATTQTRIAMLTRMIAAHLDESAAEAAHPHLTGITEAQIDQAIQIILAATTTDELLKGLSAL